VAEVDQDPPEAAPSAPAHISDQHDLSNFDCGKPSLNDWLMHRALKSEGRSARAYVVTAGRRVVGYYCISTGAVIAREAPGGLRRNMPDPIAVMIIGRLAVDKHFQGRHIGAAMLKDALRRILGVSQSVGARAVMVHALDDEAIAFAAFGFKTFPAGSRTLFLSISEIAAALG
jgi:GNAT superfamily N-acetyltransferase